jgi:hypothetical protein
MVWLLPFVNIYNASTSSHNGFRAYWTKVIDPYLPITYHC